MNQIKIALVQMESKLYQVPYNLQKSLMFIEEAVQEGVDIICFPELSLSGYSSKFSKKNAITVDDESIHCLKYIAQEKQIAILTGMVEKENNNLYITHCLISTNGEMNAYRKIHLGSKESRVFNRGNKIVPFELRIGNQAIKLGIGLCYDWHFPEVATALSVEGAQILFAPHASPLNADQRIKIWKKYLTSRAYDNRVYFAACNLLFEDNKHGGGIGIWNPDGELVTQWNVYGDKMLIYSVDLEDVNQYRDHPMNHKNYISKRQTNAYLSTNAFKL